MTYGQKVNRIKKSLASMPLPMQAWVLEIALKEILQMPSSSIVKIDGKFVHDLPAYIKGQNQWKASLDEARRV